MQSITPHLWFDKQAKEAAHFYTTIFPNSLITSINTIHEVPSPSGECDIVSFTLVGQSFIAISAGPTFTLNPSISFFVNFDPASDKNAKQNLDILWNKLSQGGKALMPLDKYFFSERYGWIQDKYGVSWQLILTNPDVEPRPTIIPSFLFVGDVAGRAEEAGDFYLSIFKNSKRGVIARYGKGQEPDKEGTVMYSDFMLNGQWFVAMDSAHKHDFSFNEAISLLIPCDTQDEIDYYWEKLSADPKAEQCGWLKDKFGVSWQVRPTVLEEMISKGTPEQIKRLIKAFLTMKKYDIALLRQAFENNE